MGMGKHLDHKLAFQALVACLFNVLLLPKYSMQDVSEPTQGLLDTRPNFSHVGH